MTSTNFIMRPLQTDAELERFITLANDAFAHEYANKSSTDWRFYLEHNPQLQTDSIRGAFSPDDGDRLLGGYILVHRHMRLGAASLPTVCIGNVVVDPAQRKRGIGAALMQDSIAHAQDNHIALMFLTGIANFYGQFGYVSAPETTDITLARADIQSLPKSETVRVRPATITDAPALLNLYRRQFYLYAGAFERSLAEQEFLLRHNQNRWLYLLAETGDSEPSGYLLLGPSAEQMEVAAFDWPSIAALLQTQETRLDASAQTDTMWSIPVDCPLFYHLAENISFRSEKLHHYDCDWMARAGHLPALMATMLPAWQHRWRTARIGWQGTLVIDIDGAAFWLKFSSDGVDLLTRPTVSAQSMTASLSRKAIVQLCFGYRPAGWFAAQTENHISPDVLLLLDTLFPRIPFAVANSDLF